VLFEYPDSIKLYGRDVQRKNVVNNVTSQVNGHHDTMARTKTHRTSKVYKYATELIDIIYL